MKFAICDLRLMMLAALLFLAPASFAQPVMFSTNEIETNLYPIDLPTALRLAGARNLDVQIARQKLAEARANNEGATLEFFPWLNVGIAYRRHDGQIQSTEGNIETVSKQSYAPGGALVSQLDLGDAIYSKLAAKQLEHAAGYSLQAQQQDSIAAAARDYFNLSFAQAAVGVAREALRISTNYEARVRTAADAGIAFKGDLLRVSVEAEHNRMTLRQAAEQQRVAAARLAQTLHLNPSMEFFAADASLTPLTLIDTNSQHNDRRHKHFIADEGRLRWCRTLAQLCFRTEPSAPGRNARRQGISTDGR